MELLQNGKLTKEDYMCLSKERLAELLVERDNCPTIQYIPYYTPYTPHCIPVIQPYTCEGLTQPGKENEMTLTMPESK